MVRTPWRERQVRFASWLLFDFRCRRIDAAEKVAEARLLDQIVVLRLTFRVSRVTVLPVAERVRLVASPAGLCVSASLTPHWQSRTQWKIVCREIARRSDISSIVRS